MNRSNWRGSKGYNKLKVIQGGEIKVMKKSLSILLVFVLVLSLFSAISSAATGSGVIMAY